MCDATCSESGQLLTINPCGWYLKITSDRDRLAGVVQGMEDQNARNLETLRRAEVENARITLQYDQLDDIFRQRGLDLSQSEFRRLVLEKENARLREALEKVFSIPGSNACFAPAQYYIHVKSIVGNALKEVE